MRISPFKLERYFAEYEFKVKYLLSPSDIESLSMKELLHIADPDSISLWDNLRLSYTESAGLPALRQEIADLYQTVSPENILTAAPEEAIFIAMNVLLKPGDHVISVYPAYQSLYSIAEANGCDVTPWPVEAGETGWWLDFNRLESSLTSQTRLLVINFPHNPTGYLPSRQELEIILGFARQHDLYLFSDEMYRLLEYDPNDRLPAVCDVYEKGISLSGLSKTFALPGLRTGWLATRDQAILERCQGFKDYTTICPSAPAEILSLMALRARNTILVRNMNIIIQNVSRAKEYFTEHRDYFRWMPPQAGSVAFLEWLGKGPVEEFCQRALDQEQVMILPGEVFDYPGNYFRLGLGRTNLAEALEKITGILD